AANIAESIAIHELQTGSGLNQICSLQRAGDTRWGSHLNSLRSLISLFDATCSVLETAIDSQLQELNNRFNDTTMELLVLCSALDPRDNYKLFKVDDICKLAAKFYPDDFTEQEKLYLRIQLQHYELDVPNHAELKKLLTIAELSHGLVKTEKSEIYHLVFKLIRLVLTLPVSIATIERSFLAMKIVKTRLRNKMEDEYLADYLVTYIEKRIAMQFSTDSIIDDFYDMKERR
ncbi:Dimer_Tnp_hAT domain-containing protein, partial [Cephalotus follicularis]